MEPDYEISAKIRFDRISFLFGTVAVDDRPIPVAIFQRDDVIVTCRVVCPDNQRDAKTWLVEQLHELLTDEQRASCHDLPCCRDCVRSMRNIHNRLSSWLTTERHHELLEAISNVGQREPDTRERAGIEFTA